MSEREKVLQKLGDMNITYTLEEHPAICTIEDIDRLGIVGDLFLRDARGAHHLLVALPKDKQADLKSLSAQVGCSQLSFASNDNDLGGSKWLRQS
jgi:Ala-tRNA(Pro) deacylase